MESWDYKCSLSKVRWTISLTVYYIYEGQITCVVINYMRVIVVTIYLYIE